MKVAMPLAKNVLAPLGLTAAMSAIDGSIQKKIHGSGVKLIIEQEDMNDTISLSRHEQVCLMRLLFERYFSHHRDNKNIFTYKI